MHDQQELASIRQVAKVTSTGLKESKACAKGSGPRLSRRIGVLAVFLAEDIAKRSHTDGKHTMPGKDRIAHITSMYELTI